MPKSESLFEQWEPVIIPLLFNAILKVITEFLKFAVLLLTIFLFANEIFNLSYYVSSELDDLPSITGGDNLEAYLFELSQYNVELKFDKYSKNYFEQISKWPKRLRRSSRSTKMLRKSKYAFCWNSQNIKDT